MDEIDGAFLAKARDSLACAESEYANRRYDNCASRCYYACFQAAVEALRKAGVRRPPSDGRWSHAFVQAEFVGQLINRRKVYPAELRDVLVRGLELRHVADYRGDRVPEIQAARALRRTRALVSSVSGQGRGR